MTRRKSPRTRDIAKEIIDVWATERGAEIDRTIVADAYGWLNARFDLALRRAAADMAIDLLAEWWDGL